ncbi:MAG TPA: twin-arginine translocation signal domain-containing protein [Dehalococcoidia bacterium]|jgi:hypothetical protein|nr:twin-arginine translocation signal domain-containing protein [Dehalococcoidia bacterium]
MAKLSRRSLITKTGMGAAAAGVLVAAPSVVLSHRRGTTTSARTPSNPLAASAQAPTVAYVRDARKGEVVLMFGEREVVRTDPELVAYLSRCCSAAGA